VDRARAWGVKSGIIGVGGCVIEGGSCSEGRGEALLEIRRVFENLARELRDSREKWRA